MVVTENLQEEIDAMVKTNYSKWLIGITTDPEKTKERNRMPRHWEQWKMETKEEACRIRDYFREKGCMGQHKLNQERILHDDKQVYLFIF